jgi:hypothetical protein
VKAPLGDGAAGILAALSAVGSTLLMLHFLRCLAKDTPREGTTARRGGILLSWLVVAPASVALPWLLLPELGDVSWRDVLAPVELWSACWPVLVGGIAAFALRRWDGRPPRVPEGDLLAVSQRAVSAMCGIGQIIETIDGQLRRWSTAGILLLACAVFMAGTLLIGR